MSKKPCHLPSGRCGLKFDVPAANPLTRASPPFGEVWIEISHGVGSDTRPKSPPFGEVWIEIQMPGVVGQTGYGHLPSGRCGLKSQHTDAGRAQVRHLPSGRCGLKFRNSGAGRIGLSSPPFGEVWIEIRTGRSSRSAPASHLPSGRCGLK